MSRMPAPPDPPNGTPASDFDRDAESYELWYETPRGHRASEAERRLLRSLVAPNGSSGRLLEVGCGTGHFTEWLDREAGRSAFGLDLSTPMLREGRRRGRRFPIVRGDAHRLPFASRSFDVVLFITTLEFLDDPLAALQEAIRVARSQIVVLWLNPWSIGALRRAWAPGHRSSRAQQLNVGQVRRMLIQAARGREEGIVWKSALFPWPLSNARLRVPAGDIIGMKLTLASGPAGGQTTEIHR